MATAPFPIVPELTAISQKYRNNKMVADAVSPRVPVMVQDFKYWVHTMQEGFTIPDTRVGRKGVPAEVEFTAAETPATTQDYGLDDPVPQADINNAPPNRDPVARAVEGVTDLILLDREIRVSSLVFNAANYASANKVTLSGTSQFSDFTNSDPIGIIMAGLDSCVMRPNIMVIGRAAFSKLAQHPKVVKAVLANAGDSGIVQRQSVAAIFELDEVIVGEAWLNTAKKGQAASMSRVWGKHISLLCRDMNADAQNAKPTFTFTAQWGERVSGAMADPKISVRGGQRVRVYESLKECVVAPDLGYFIQNAVA